MVGLVSIAWLLTTLDTAAATERSAAQILREFDAVSYPSMSEGSDAQSLERFQRQIDASARRQQALALELLESHPEHARVPEVMQLRWTLFCTVKHDARAVLEETDRLAGENASEPMAVAAAAVRALAAVSLTDVSFANRMEIVQAALERAPNETLVGDAIAHLLKYHTADAKQQQELAAILEQHFAHDPYVGREATMVSGLVARIGKPVDVTFAHVAERGTGDLPASTSGWQGKPFLLTFRVDLGDHVSDIDIAEQAAMAKLRERFAANDLPIITVVDALGETAPQDVIEHMRKRGVRSFLYVDQADWQTSLSRTAFGAGESPLTVLVDREGKLVAWSFRIEPLLTQIEPLRIPRRRAI